MDWVQFSWFEAISPEWLPREGRKPERVNPNRYMVKVGAFSPIQPAVSLSLWRQAWRHWRDHNFHRMTVTVAHLRGEPDAPVGWVAYQPGTIHWVHVEPEERRQGVGSVLLRHALREIGIRPRQAVYVLGERFRVTHLTPAGQELLQSLAGAGPVARTRDRGRRHGQDTPSTEHPTPQQH